MKKLISFCIIFLFVSIVFAQEGWNIQSSGYASDIFFVSNNVGYAAGNNYSILKTEDGGETWEGLNTGFPLNGNLNAGGAGALYFIDAQRGWYINGHNTILKTSNGGTSWNSLTSGVVLTPSQFVHFTNLFFLDSQNGWVVGYIANINGADYSGIILKTTDGGDTWTNQIFGVVLYSVNFATAQKGWLVGAAGTLLYSSDGGTNWSSQYNGIQWGFRDVKFRDENFGIVVGNAGKIFVTTNGGINWEDKNFPFTYNLNSLSLTQSGICYVMGQGKLYKSNNSGETWSLVYEYPDYMEAKIFFENNNMGWYAGNRGIAKTTDGGNTWIQQTFTNTINKIFALKSPIKLWGVQDKGIVRSSDGKKWRFTPNDQISNISDMYFRDEYNGWLVGGYNLSTKLFRTTDAGNTWTNQTVNVNQNLQSIFFVDQTYGWIAGTNGTILQTLDSGSTWGSQVTPTVAHLNDIAFYDTQLGYAVGKGTYGVHTGQNVILKTYNSGLLWNVIYAETANDQFGHVFCFDENTFLVISNKKVYKSSDGGTTLNTLFVNTQSSFSITSAEFFGPANGYLATTEGIYRTLDGGSTWNSNINLSCQSLTFISPTEGWGASSSYGIIHTKNGGVSSVETIENGDFIPDGYSLEQNFPNPFNPSTTILFNLPQNEFVTLKIYDILGKEITTLINQQLNAGSYKNLWSPSNLASGIYFYSLQAGKFNQTRKMIFLK
ncbi:MAG: YCF48-related protein [bacterium]